jgi:hypothetical protein
VEVATLLLFSFLRDLRLAGKLHFVLTRNLLLVFQVGIVLLALFGVIMYRIAISALLRMTDSKYLQIHATFIESVASAVLQVVFIKLYGKVCS